jgi:hypothetical protein
MISLNEINELDELEHKDAVYHAALHYITQGIYIIPLRQNSKQLPIASYNINYGSASKKKNVIEKWFNPKDGKFAGWNIGIACGRSTGVFAVDIDISDEADGFITWNEFEAEFGEVNAPTQETPRGGVHMIFQWQENAVSSTGKIGKGIDTRGGEENKCKSHIVVYPSIVNDKQYRWTKGGEIPSIPPWVMDKMGVAWRSNSRQSVKVGRGSEEMTQDDVEKKVPLGQIERMLKSIDPNELTYDEWLRVGQSINSQYPDQEGLKIWDTWSKQGDRYKTGECSVRWNGFSPLGTVRIGTLFYYAKQGGWERTEDDVVTSKYDELVAEINKQFAMVLVGNKVRIIYEKDHVIDSFMSHYELLTKDDFKTLLSNRLEIVATDRGPKMVPISDIWLAHGGRRTYLDGIGLFPNGDKPGFYNTWRGFDVKPVEGICTKFNQHIERVICNENIDHAIWLFDWIADLIQDPANPKGCAIIMRGDEGTGKGIFGNMICELLGFHARHLIDDSHLTGNFNAHMVDALVVFADEIIWGGNRKSAGKLKGMVTERYLLAERKGVDVTPYRNMIHMIAASNEEWVIPAGPHSRRWFVLDVPDTRRSDKEYFDAIGHELDNGGREAFLYNMLHREITSNLSEAPETKALDEQRARNIQGGSVAAWWSVILEIGEIVTPYQQGENGEKQSWPNMVDRMDLFKKFESWCMDRNISPPIPAIFYRTMEEYGAKSYRPKDKGIRKYKYKMPPLEEAILQFQRATSIVIGD